MNGNQQVQEVFTIMLAIGYQPKPQNNYQLDNESKLSMSR